MLIVCRPGHGCECDVATALYVSDKNGLLFCIFFSDKESCSKRSQITNSDLKPHKNRQAEMMQTGKHSIAVELYISPIGTLLSQSDLMTNAKYTVKECATYNCILRLKVITNLNLTNLLNFNFLSILKASKCIEFMTQIIMYQNRHSSQTLH